MEKEHLRKFRAEIWAHYKKHGRHSLPWRKTKNPYRILVSEIMLQQTQVDRVVPYYRAFLRAFPTARALSRAPLASVLRVWQGLGYNRRAKMLHEAGKAIVREYGGRFPKDASLLPGVGSYTARAIDAFAHNLDVVLVETNIRTAVIHYFFPKKKKVSDTDIESVLIEVLPLGRAREWYSALMDYGAHLKRSGIRLNAKSKGYVKQSAFAGSNREARGAILKALSESKKAKKALITLLGSERKMQMERALTALLEEGLVEKGGSGYQLAG